MQDDFVLQNQWNHVLGIHFRFMFHFSSNLKLGCAVYSQLYVNRAPYFCIEHNSQFSAAKQMMNRIRCPNSYRCIEFLGKKLHKRILANVKRKEKTHQFNATGDILVDLNTAKNWLILLNINESKSSE